MAEVVGGSSPLGNPMSYKKKKLKKSKFNQLRYKLGLVKIALLKRTKVRFPKRRSTSKNQTEKRGVQMLQMDKVLASLRRYDRMKDNPDSARLEQAVAEQIQQEGLLRLCVFVCPKFSPKALASKIPENYMPVEFGRDLFEPRIAKILSLKKALMSAGLPTEINLLIGDNDAEEYIFPFLKSLDINTALYRQRQSAYRASLEERCRGLFGRAGLLVWSMAENNVKTDDVAPTVSKDGLRKEADFLKWLFSNQGPYRGALNFPEEVLTQMAKTKYGLYGAQGKFLEVLGGILLQTEGPGMWLERTQMLRSTGSPAVPVVYPWIRKEETRS